MKKNNWFLGLFFACLWLSSSAQKTVLDKVVAVVGTEVILLSEVEEQFALLQSQRGSMPPEARCAIMDQLLSARLMVNQAALDSLIIEEEEVENQLNARIEKILAYMNGDISQFESYYGQSIGDVKESFRGDLRSQITMERMRSKILGDVKITPSEVKAFFKQIPVDSLPYFNSEVEIAEVVMLPQVNEEERQKSIEKLQELRKRITEGGEDFAEIAARYSADGSARGGGDLGWAKRGRYVPEFEAAAYNLDVNEISEVVETQFGFHLMQMLERRGNSIHVRHILIQPKITQADLDLTRAKIDSVSQLIRADSLSFSYAVKKYGNKDQQSYNNDGRMSNPSTGNTFFEIGDLEPDIYFAIDTLKENGITGPIEFEGPDGKTYYRILQLQTRSKPHKASLEQDYSKIQQAAVEAKKSEYINEWLIEKLGSTYISIDPDFAQCDMLDVWYNNSRQIQDKSSNKSK